MFKYKHKWFDLIQEMSEDELNKQIEVFIKPKGHLYVVKDEGEYTTLTSKDRTHFNDPISKELVSLGYQGNIVLESIDSLERPKSWLNQYLDNENEMSDSSRIYYEDKIRIHVFGECEASNIYNIQRTMSIMVDVGDVEEINRTRGSTSQCDGLIFEYDSEWYQLIPTRTIKGRICSFDGENVILLIKSNGIVRPVIVKWRGDADEDIIGKWGYIKYTKHLGIDHINTLLSPILYSDKVFTQEEVH